MSIITISILFITSFFIDGSYDSPQAYPEVVEKRAVARKSGTGKPSMQRSPDAARKENQMTIPNTRYIPVKVPSKLDVSLFKISSHQTHCIDDFQVRLTLASLLSFYPVEKRICTMKEKKEVFAYQASWTFLMT